MNNKEEEKQVKCFRCHESIVVSRKTITHKWDGSEWQHSEFGEWSGHCPNNCGFISGDKLFSYGLRPEPIGDVVDG